MLLMFERGTQALTQAVHRYTQVNNKYMGARFDYGKESCYFHYLDANSLYGWAMSQNLPTGRFKWVENPAEHESNIHKLAKEAGKGYLLEVESPVHVQEKESPWSLKVGSEFVQQEEVPHSYHSSQTWAGLG